MELRQLEYFQMASRLRNITRAAERLRVSQPNITVAIKKLEEELTKKYGAGEDYQFVNGLLGAVARDHGLSDEAVTESAEQ